MFGVKLNNVGHDSLGQYIIHLDVSCLLGTIYKCDTSNQLLMYYYYLLLLLLHLYCALSQLILRRNDVLLLGQRRRWWANINPALGQRLVFAVYNNLIIVISLIPVKLLNDDIS